MVQIIGAQMVAFNGVMPDMPPGLYPRGMTYTETTVNRKTVKQWTYVCPDNEECYAFAYSDLSAGWAMKYIEGHVCPAPHRRSAVPSGRGWTEKMWDTMDDALDAYASGEPFLDLLHNELGGFTKGIAECLAIACIPKYLYEEVLEEAKRRRRMRKGLIPFSPTPGYRFSPLPGATRTSQPPEFAGYYSDKQDSKPATKPVKRQAKAVAPSVALPPTPPTVILSSEQQAEIKKLVGSGSPVDLVASLFGVSENRINSIVSPPKTFLPLPY